MKHNIIKTIGTANANALTFNVIVKQKSTNVKDGVTLTSHFKANFDVNIARFFTMGKALSRIVKALNFQIVQGKQSGKLKGLSLRNAFKFEVYHNDILVFESVTDEFNAKCGLTEKSQNRFFRNVAKQYNKAFQEKSEYYLTETSEDDSLYTLEMDSKLFREAMDMNICDALDIIA